jgi:hypothetical protein
MRPPYISLMFSIFLVPRQSRIKYISAYVLLRPSRHYLAVTVPYVCIRLLSPSSFADTMSPIPNTRVLNAGRPQAHDGDMRHMYNSTRLTKVITTLLASVCASFMSLFAFAHGHQMHRDNFDFEVLSPAQPPWHLVTTEPPAVFFFIASMSFTTLSYANYSSNRSDVYQNTILISGTVSGLLVALSLDTGVLSGIFGLEPWFLLLSLVLSDFFHFVCVRKQRCTCDECVRNEEFGDEKA